MDSLSFKLGVVNSSLSKPSDFYVDLICEAYITNELKIRSISVTVHDENELIRKGISIVKYANVFQIDFHCPKNFKNLKRRFNPKEKLRPD